MRRLLSSLAFSLLLVASVAAQGNPWSNGNSSNNQGGPNGWNNSNSNAQAPSLTAAQQALLIYLQAGNPVPMPMALDIIRQARDWGMQQFGLNLGQMIQKYAQGQLTVEFVATSPPSWTFRVVYGGINIIIIESL